MKPIKLQWAFVISISLTILMITIATIFTASNIIEKNFIKEAINVRLERNFKWTYQSLILGHTYIPINIYKSIKDDYFKEFPNISLIRSRKIDELFSLEDQSNEKIINEVDLPKDKQIFIDKKNKILIGIFPIKADIHCISCHVNAQKDEIIGAVKINLSLSEIYNTIDQSRKTLIILGIIALIFSVVTVYLVYYYLAEKKVRKLSFTISKITEGDLAFDIDKRLLEREDIIGQISRDLKSIQDYLINFISKILDFSIKLTKQIDKVYHSVELIDSNAKNLNLSYQELEFDIENIYRRLSEFNRTTNKFLELTRTFERKLSAEFNENQISEEKIRNITELLDDIKNKTLTILENMEGFFKDEDKIYKKLETVKDLLISLKNLQENIYKFIHETLIISTYLKNIVSTFRIPQMEEIIFDIFESDLDRYILRIESHLKEIEKLDPERWGDPQALSLGKWILSDEYNQLKERIKDFNFTEFENIYNKLIELGKETIKSYNLKDYKQVEKLINELRTNYLFLKGLLEELKILYLELYQVSHQKEVK